MVDMRNMLRFKAALVGSALEEPSKSVRQWLRRLRPNLELAEILLEEERLPAILEQLLSKTSNVLDIGCHIGSFLSMATRLSPDGHHVAVEASPLKANLLRKKFPSVTIEQVAISDSDGVALFHDDLDNPGFSRLGGGISARGRVLEYEVRTSTLDSLSLGRFDLVKLDIEGAELAALRSGTDFFRRSRPYLIFECGAAANEDLDRAALYDHVVQTMKYSVFTFADFIYKKGSLSSDEFRKCGLYPFRAFNFVAVPNTTQL